MRLVANWRGVLRHAWSLRLIVLSIVLSGAEMAVQFAGPALPIPPLTLGALSFGVTIAAGVARLVAQPNSIGDR